MSEQLLSWFQHFVTDPADAKKRLNGRCVLVYEPPALPEGDDYQYQTSGDPTDGPLGGHEPLVALVEKTQNNVFQRRITLGRTSNNDIPLSDVSVSRFHAWLEQDEKGQWLLADAGSRNGTHIEGKRLVAKQPQVLTPGSKLKVGSVNLQFHSAESFFADLERRSRG